MSIPDFVSQAIEKWAKQREDAAYQRGWDACAAALMEAAAKQRSPNSPPLAEHPVRDLSQEARLIGELAQATNRERVAFALRSRPGMRMAEVPRFLAEFVPDINVQSIYTTIKRMRPHQIESRCGELYLKAKEAA